MFLLSSSASLTGGRPGSTSIECSNKSYTILKLIKLQRFDTVIKASYPGSMNTAFNLFLKVHLVLFPVDHYNSLSPNLTR